MVILENIDIDIDIDKEILANIDIDKIANQLEFGISHSTNRTSHMLEVMCWECQILIQNHKASFRDEFLGLPLRWQLADVGIGIHSRCCQPEGIALASTIKVFFKGTMRYN